MDRSIHVRTVVGPELLSNNAEMQDEVISEKSGILKKVTGKGIELVDSRSKSSGNESISFKNAIPIPKIMVLPAGNRGRYRADRTPPLPL